LFLGGDPAGTEFEHFGGGFKVTGEYILKEILTNHSKLGYCQNEAGFCQFSGCALLFMPFFRFSSAKD
jgi:hypothetical protein